MSTGVYIRSVEMRDDKGRFLEGLKIRKRCLICNKEFETLVNSKRKYCSRECYYKSKEKKIIKICGYCGKEFSQPGAKLYCSPRCYQSASRKRITKICPVCQRSFTTFPSTNRIYCSEKCYGMSQRRRIKKVCIICSKKFEVVRSQKEAKYCSDKCRYIGNRGHIAWDKGLKRPKHSERMKRENNPNWQDGISNLPYTFEFNKQLKELIRHGDSYKCQLCGIPECENIKKLSIHHIDYNKENPEPNNLITLCISCNSKVNFNRSRWEGYFDKKIKKIMNNSKIQLNLNFKIEEKGSKICETFI